MVIKELRNIWSLLPPCGKNLSCTFRFQRNQLLMELLFVLRDSQSTLIASLRRMGINPYEKACLKTNHCHIFLYQTTHLPCLKELWRFLINLPQSCISLEFNTMVSLFPAGNPIESSLRLPFPRCVKDWKKRSPFTWSLPEGTIYLWG